MFASSSDSRAALLQDPDDRAIVIGGLYIGREVLLPLALAILLSFVLTPLLLLLRRIKVPRVPAVTIVVALAFAIIFALGWLLSHQVAQLAATCPAISTCSPGRSRPCANRRSRRAPSRTSPARSRASRTRSPKGRSAASGHGPEPPGRKGSRQAHPRRDQRAGAAALGDFSKRARHRAAAARHRRHRHSLCDLHPVAARGFARRDRLLPRTCSAPPPR